MLIFALLCTILALAAVTVVCGSLNSLRLPPLRKIVIAFHYPCKDGAISAALATHFLSWISLFTSPFQIQEFNHVGWRHSAEGNSQALDQMIGSGAKEIYCLDFCPTFEQVKQLTDAIPGVRIHILDHHFKACDELKLSMEAKGLDECVELVVSPREKNAKGEDRCVQAGIGVVRSFFTKKHPYITRILDFLSPLSPIIDAIEAADIWRYRDEQHKQTVKELLAGFPVTIPPCDSDGNLVPFLSLDPKDAVRYMQNLMFVDQRQLDEIKSAGIDEFKRQREICEHLVRENACELMVGKHSAIFVPSPLCVRNGVPEVLSEGSGFVQEIVRKLYPDCGFVVMTSMKFMEPREPKDGPEGRVTLSLRQITEPVLPVARRIICEGKPGGGHGPAAGCAVNLMPEVLARVLTDNGAHVDAGIVQSLPAWNDRAISMVFGTQYIPYPILAKSVGIAMAQQF